MALSRRVAAVAVATTIQRVQHLCLTHRDLALWIDVRLREFDGRWLAVADFADEPDVGVGHDPRVALREALMALGPRMASELAESAQLGDQERVEP